jgi:excisionase family DNA binding protein
VFSVELTFKVAGREVSLDEFAQAVLAKSFDGFRPALERLRSLSVPAYAPTAGSESRRDVRAVSIARAAELVGLSKWTVYKYVSEGRLHSVRAGRRVLIPMETLDQLLREGLPSLRRTGSGR